MQSTMIYRIGPDILVVTMKRVRAGFCVQCYPVRQLHLADPCALGEETKESLRRFTDASSDQASTPDFADLVLNRFGFASWERFARNVDSALVDCDGRTIRITPQVYRTRWNQLELMAEFVRDVPMSDEVGDLGRAIADVLDVALAARVDQPFDHGGGRP